MPEVPPKEAIPEKKVPVAPPKKPEAPPVKGMYPPLLLVTHFMGLRQACIGVSSGLTNCIA